MNKKQRDRFIKKHQDQYAKKGFKFTKMEIILKSANNSILQKVKISKKDLFEIYYEQATEYLKTAFNK